MVEKDISKLSPCLIVHNLHKIGIVNKLYEELTVDELEEISTGISPRVIELLNKAGLDNIAKAIDDMLIKQKVYPICF